MIIPDKVYEELSPQARVAAALAAMARSDDNESMRLVTLMPADNRIHRKEWLAASQAMNAYLILALLASKNIAVSAVRLYGLAKNVDRITDMKLLNEIEIKVAAETKLFDGFYSQLKAVETITARWCQAKGINPVDISLPFSLPVPREWPAAECDPELLTSVDKLINPG